MSGVRYLRRDKNKNIFPENVYCRKNVELEFGDLEMNSNDINNVNDVNASNINTTSINTTSIDATSIDATDVTTETVFITNDVGQTPSTSCQVHIADTQDICVWLEADTNNITETDTGYLLMTRDGNATAYKFVGSAIDNHLEIVSGTLTALPQGIRMVVADITGAVQGTEPAFSNQKTVLLLERNLSTFSTDVDFGGNDLLNAGNRYFNIVESIGITNNAGGWLNKVTLTDTFNAGDYEISLSALVGNTTNNDDVTEIRLQEDGVTMHPGTMSKPKIDSPVGPPIRYVPMSASFITTLTAASHTFTLDFQPTPTTGTTGSIRDARIIIRNFY